MEAIPTSRRMELQRAFQRSIIVPFPEPDRGAPEPTPGALLRLLLRPFGLNHKGPLWIHELNLERGFVVVLNGSNFAVDCTGMHLCNEERRNRFNFPPGFILAPRAQVTVYCGVTAPLSPAKGPGGALYWAHERLDAVLNRRGDAMYLWDGAGRICSALAKSDDGATKRYAPSQDERLHCSFANLVSERTAVKACAPAALIVRVHLLLFRSHRHAIVVTLHLATPHRAPHWHLFSGALPRFAAAGVPRGRGGIRLRAAAGGERG